MSSESKLRQGYDEIARAVNDAMAAEEPAEERVELDLNPVEVPETSAPEVEPEEKEVEQPEEKEPEAREHSIEDEIRTLRTEMLAHISNLASNSASRRDEVPAPQPEQQSLEPTRYLTDADLHSFNQNMHEHAERVNKMVQEQERIALRNAEAELKAKYPDLDEFIPAERRAAALEYVFQGRDYGKNWTQEIEKVYKQLAFDKHRSRADELEQKRIEKKAKAEQVKSASVVPAGGSVYQAPAEKRPVGDSRYEWAKQQMLRDMQ